MSASFAVTCHCTSLSLRTSFAAVVVGGGIVERVERVHSCCRVEAFPSLLPGHGILLLQWV